MQVLLIDGLNLIRRIHAGVRRLEDLETNSQSVEEACVNSLSRALRYHHPSHVVCAMDSEAPSWREALFPEYKKNRHPMPGDLRSQLGRIISRFGSLNVRTVLVDGFEADDVIASVARQVVAAGSTATILSTDKSFCQLISDYVHVYDHFASRQHDRDYVRQKFGVEAAQIPDLFALAGDSSLNISGARGIGLRTAEKLLGEYGNLESVLGAVKDISASWAKKIRDSEESVRLALCLFTLRSDVSVGANLRDFRIK